METDIETGQGSQVIVIAEAPAPDRVDDWLSPPLRPQQAALVAEAALADTLDVVAAAPVTRRVLALDGAPGDWLPDGFRVFGQRGGGLDERLAAAFADAYAVAPLPMVLIGTDTPQVTVGHARRRGRVARVRRGGRGIRARRPTAGSGCSACAGRTGRCWRASRCPSQDPGRVAA